MSAPTWHERNDEYLSASLHWLRARIDGLESAQKRDGGRLREAEARRHAAASGMEPPPALQVLADRLGLSAFERDTLLLAAAVEFDPGIAASYARAQGDAARGAPTFGLAFAALPDPTWDALSPHAPLRRAHLVEVNQPASTPLTSSPLRADERIVNYLKGLNAVDERVSTLFLPLDDEDTGGLSDSQNEAVAETLQELRAAADGSIVPVVQLSGPDAGSKAAVAARTCRTLGRRLHRVGIEMLPTQLAEAESLARLWERESVLLPVALFIDAEGFEELSGEAQSSFRRFVSRGAGLIFLGVRESAIRLGERSLWVPVDRPNPGEQCDAWLEIQAESGDEGDDADARDVARQLAGQFSLNLHEIREIGMIAVGSPADGRPLGDRLWDACRDRTRPRLDSLAQRLDVKADWDDLVLPDEQMALMKQIAGQVRERHTVYDAWGFAQKMNRGFGITALFTGESGTGKTMGAEVIANDLRLNLYRIDLSAVVSKYIGETPKNLRRLFDAAEQGGAILFFDEADALFGKRSEVKDSHDRYANIEVNYLLQRMEAFSGLAILSTNLKTALDAAFLRRLRFVVNFQFPGIAERKRIWQRALPDQTPQERLDFDRLARLNVTGGNIHSIAINAAFLAASRRSPVTMPLLLSAARTEMRKLERPFSEAEFRFAEEPASAS